MKKQNQHSLATYASALIDALERRHISLPPDEIADAAVALLDTYHRDEQTDTLSHRLQTEPSPMSRKRKPNTEGTA